MPSVPGIGCNHKLFCAAGHFSFVLWFLKMEQRKTYLVWKSHSSVKHWFAVGDSSAKQSDSLSFLCLALFCFVLVFSVSFRFRTVSWVGIIRHLPEAGHIGSASSRPMWVCLCDSTCEDGVCGCGLVLLWFFSPFFSVAALLLTLQSLLFQVHCNLTLDVWSAAIAPDLHSHHLQMNRATFPYPVSMLC